MVEQIYEQLKTPKTLEELHQRLHDIGIRWNQAQIELFLSMDKNIVRHKGLYSIVKNNINDIVLEIIDKTIGNRPMVPIIKIMKFIPDDIVVSSDEILCIATNSCKYENINGSVLKRIK